VASVSFCWADAPLELIAAAMGQAVPDCPPEMGGAAQGGRSFGGLQGMQDTRRGQAAGS
jgi:hypothetical protein